MKKGGAAPFFSFLFRLERDLERTKVPALVGFKFKFVASNNLIQSLNFLHEEHDEIARALKSESPGVASISVPLSGRSATKLASKAGGIASTRMDPRFHQLRIKFYFIFKIRRTSIITTGECVPLFNKS